MRAILDCGCVINSDGHRHWCPSCTAGPPPAPKPQKKINFDPIHLQAEEFNRLHLLCRALNNLPPVVDDDYPEMRHHYERELEKFIVALRDNGRIL